MAPIHDVALCAESGLLFESETVEMIVLVDHERGRKVAASLLVGVVLAVLLIACGGSGKDTATKDPEASYTHSVANHENDHDDSDDGNIHNITGERNDDEEVLNYGHVANETETRAALEFANHYLKAAAADDGARVCSLLAPHLARSIPAGYGRPPDPVYLRGKTCAEVMTKLFKQRHRRMAFEAANYKVIGVRTVGRTAFILLSFKHTLERRYMGVERYGRSWKLEALLDSEYP
jgi:hypothetical protein